MTLRTLKNDAQIRPIEIETRIIIHKGVSVRGILARVIVTPFVFWIAKNARPKPKRIAKIKVNTKLSIGLYFARVKE